MVDPLQPNTSSLQQPTEPTPPVAPPASHPNLIVLIIFAIILFVFCGVGYILLQTRKPFPQAAQTVNSQSSPTQPIIVTPTPEIVDTAPGLPAKQKAQVQIHHSDSTFSTYLVPLTSVSAYIHTLPKGDSVVKVVNP